MFVLSLHNYSIQFNSNEHYRVIMHDGGLLKRDNTNVNTESEQIEGFDRWRRTLLKLLLQILNPSA